MLLILNNCLICMTRIWQFIDISFSKHFAALQNVFKLLKIASTTGKMTFNTLFSFCCPNFRHSCLKNPIPDVELSFHQLIFQSYCAFPFFTAFFSHICTKKIHSSDSKHFHGRGCDFHGMNAQSTTVDLISNSFMQDI